jgi:large subunit ribosomal protein L14
MKAVSGRQMRGLPVGARLTCVDNTGAKVVQIVMVLQYHSVMRRYPTAGVGHMVLISVKKGTPEMRKQMFQAVIVRQRRPFRRPDGTMVQFEDNAAVITTDTGELKGSDIKGPVAREAAERYPRIAAAASAII